MLRLLPGILLVQLVVQLIPAAFLLRDCCRFRRVCPWPEARQKALGRYLPRAVVFIFIGFLAWVGLAFYGLAYHH